MGKSLCLFLWPWVFAFTLLPRLSSSAESSVDESSGSFRVSSQVAWESCYFPPTSIGAAEQTDKLDENQCRVWRIHELARELVSLRMSSRLRHPMGEILGTQRVNQLAAVRLHQMTEDLDQLLGQPEKLNADLWVAVRESVDLTLSEFVRGGHRVVGTKDFHALLNSATSLLSLVRSKGWYRYSWNPERTREGMELTFSVSGQAP